jgi:glycosyltransferase involved in cell wall biosynthesis
MKTIIIFCNSSWNIYNFRKNLIKTLQKKYRVITISGRDKFSKKITNLSKAYFVDLENRSVNFFKNIKEIFYLKKILNKYPDSIMLNFTNKSVILGSISIFFNKIEVINVVTGLGHAFLQKNFFVSLIIKFLYSLIVIRSKYIIVQNKFDKIFFEEKFFTKGKIKLIYGSGIDFTKFKVSRKKKINHTKTLLFFGRILREKGIFNFLEAADYFKDKKDIKFKIVGQFNKKDFSSQEAKLLKKYSKFKNINFHNFSKNIFKILDDSDCVVLPSYREGLSKTLLESTAMQKFVICSDVPGCNEIVINNFNGFLIKPKNSNDLILKIKKFLVISKNKLNIMEKNSRARTYKLFRDNIVIDKYVKIINDI